VRSLAAIASGGVDAEGELPQLRRAIERTRSPNRGVLRSVTMDAQLSNWHFGRYYRSDARTLELYLRARRVDRFVGTGLLRQRYDFILPGAIHR
jgi:hypothetical protein